MKERFSTVDMVDVLNRVCLDMEAACDQLTAIDAQSGDGDLGVSVKLGFQSVREHLAELAALDIGTLLQKAGAIFNAAAASTFGTLAATAFLRAGREMKGKADIGLDEITAMLDSAIVGIQQRGKASAGERTMLDALIPAAKALKDRSGGSTTLVEALAAAARAANDGALATAQMLPKHGRAGWIGQRAKGQPDAGATAVAMAFSSIATHSAKLGKV